MNYTVFEQLCKQSNTTPTALAMKLGLSKGNTTNWKKGGNPSVDTLMQLSVELNCTVDYLLTGKEKNSSLQEDEQELLEYYKKLPEQGRMKLIGRAAGMADVYADQQEKAIDMVPASTVAKKIPVITLRHSIYKVSAGLGHELGNGDEWDEIEVPDTPLTRRADFCLTITGDSMIPVYNDGDIVLVKSQPDIDIGEIGIFTIDGEGYIKKLGADRLISLNKEYDDIIFEAYNYDMIACRGLVLGRI